MTVRCEFDLKQVGVIDRLLTDEEFFRRCITANILEVAQRFGCDVNVSGARLRYVFQSWDEDLKRVLKDGSDRRTEVLDHYKHSAFLCFWMRRHLPVGFIFAGPPNKPVPDILSGEQKFFLRYGNEICALRVSLRMCHAYELKYFEYLIRNSDRENVHIFEQRKQVLLRSEPIDVEFEQDFVTTLHHKNNSPHSINLIFRALFSRFRGGGRPVL